MVRRRCRAGFAARTALVLACAGAVCVALPDPARAATFTVDTTDDTGVGSLRQAILDANASPGTDTVVFMLPAGSTITLGSDLPDLTGVVVIDASGAPDLTLDGDGAFVILRTGSDAEVVDLGAESGEIQLGDGHTLTLTANQDFEISAAIVDAVALPVTPGDLVKKGAATLILSGNNTFTGLLSIEEGTLVGDAASLPGDIANDAALVFDQIGAATYAGAISGTGSVEKVGNGNLTLTGANTYAGGTTITRGTLTGNTTSLQGDIEIAEDASLVFAQTAADGDFDGDITGDGELTKQGAFDLRLTGSNDYAGGTRVEGGRLLGDTAAIQGNVDLDGGDLVFEQPGNGSFGGSITGTGSVTKQDAGNLTLTGANSYSGGTFVEGGTLTGNTSSLQGNVSLLATTALVFSQSGAGTFNGAISGAGDVVKQGGGTLTVPGAQTYTGTTTISGGVFELTGSLVSDTSVEGGGTLSGTGSISAPVTVHGTLTPAGASQGTFSVNGTAGFQAGSRFVVDMDDANAGDLLAVSGNVGVDPTATLEVRPAPGDYAAGSTVSVLTASSVTGTFLEGEPFAFLDRFVTYPGGNSVQVTLIENLANVATAGSTPNQRAVGGALSTLDGSPDPDIQTLFDNLTTLTASQVGPTLDSLSGESLSALTTARVALGERTQRTVQRRMRSLLFATDEEWPTRPAPRSTRPTRAPLGSTDVAAPPRLGERGIGGWLDGFGVLGALDGDGNSADVDYGLFGTTAGFDVRLGDHALAGVAAGYARTQVEVDDRNADADADTAQGAVYAAWANRRIYAGASGRYAWSQADHTRDIVAGSLRRKANADFDSHDYGVRGELALRAFETGPVAFEPLAGFEWNHLTREDFQESGAGSLGLDVDSETLDTALLQLGGRLHGVFPMDEESVLAPELRAYWLHEFGDDARRIDASLAGAPFTVSGAEAPRDGALVGIGWAMSLGPNVRATADYDLRIDADRMEHLASIAVRVRF